MSKWNINWKHAIGTFLLVAAGIDSYLAGPQGASVALAMHCSAGVLGLIGTIIILLQNSIKDPAAQVASDAAKKAAALRVVGSLLMLACCVLLAGCLGSSPTVPVTAANTAQISQCESTATQHDGYVIGDFVFTGTGGILGAAGAIASDPQTKTDLAVGATIAGGVAILASSLVAFSASNFATNNCSSVVGALPAVPIAPAPPPAASAGAGQ
jgi:hypothetical protein